MEKLELDKLSREEARNKIKSLPRDKSFIVDVLSDGTRFFITTNGKKISLDDGKKVGGIDITVHYDNEPKRKISYINDVFVDLIKKESIIGEKKISIIINAIKESIELTPIKEIIKRPEIKKIENMNLPGRPIEFLLTLIKCLALQEDINYWGINPKTKKRYEGREKPYNAIVDLLVKKMPLTHVTRKHKLF